MQSRFHIIRTHLVLLFTFSFFSALGLFLILYISKEVLPGKSPIPVMAFGVFCVLMALYTVYCFLKQLPRIKIDERSVRISTIFDTKEVYWSDIKRISTSGKSSFRYILPFPMEAMVIYLSKGKPIKIFDEYYVNSYKIKQYITHFHRNNEFPELLKEKKVSDSDIRFEKFESFKGDALLSFRGVMLWSVILIVFFFGLKNASNLEKAILPMLGICGLWYFFNSYMCFFTDVSSKFLVIRNHYRPWVYKKYYLDDIRELVIESRDKMPNCLRVISISYKSKLYPSGTLTDKEWRRFMAFMKEKNIKVRNESIY